MTDWIKSALRPLFRRPGRALLTMATLVIGVATLTLLSAVSAAGTDAVTAEMQAMGLDGFTVTADEGTLDRAALNTLSSLSEVTVAAPLTILPTTARLYGKETEVLVCGVDEHAGDAIAIDLHSGHMPRRQDVTSCATICTIEESAAKDAFGGLSALGRPITVTLGGGEYAFTVTGTARAKSSLLKNLTTTLPPLLFVPYSTLSALTGGEAFDRIAVRTSLSAEALLRRVQTALADKGDLKVESMASQKDRLSRLLALVSALLKLSGVTAVLAAGGSLLLTELSAVTERVAEIGLKKALGATRRRIMAEFLLSAGVLSFSGAAVGLLCGTAAAAIGLAMGGVPFTPSVARGAVLLFGTTAFGTACGLYPAAKAAALSPLEAFCRS